MRIGITGPWPWRSSGCCFPISRNIFGGRAPHWMGLCAGCSSCQFSFGQENTEAWRNLGWARKAHHTYKIQVSLKKDFIMLWSSITTVLTLSSASSMALLGIPSWVPHQRSCMLKWEGECFLWSLSLIILIIWLLKGSPSGLNYYSFSVLPNPPYCLHISFGSWMAPALLLG